MLAPIVFAMAMTADGNIPQEKVVARCAGMSITYGEIALDPVMLRLPRGPKSTTLNDDQVRHQVEQQDLDHRIVALALSFAEKHYGLHVSDQEVDALLPPRVRDEGAYRKDSEVMDVVIPRAARRVLHGEEEKRVFDEMFAGYPGMTRTFFSQALILFNTDAVIDDFLSKDQAALTRARVIEDVRLGIVRKRLTELARRRARDCDQPLEDATDALWSELLHAASAEVLVNDFKLPPWKGIL